MFSIIALQRLGEIERARAVTAGLERWVETYSTTDVGIDYFATSLPTMLLFIDDPKIDRDREVTVIRTQLAELSTSETSAATAP
jgi:hypothetical protein